MRWRSTRVDLEIWLSRVQSFPLSLSFHGDLSPNVAVVVKQHAQHIRTLELRGDFTEGLQQIITLFPSLMKLQVVDMTTHYITVSPQECIAFWGAAPALMEYDLVKIHSLGEDCTAHMLEYLTLLAALEPLLILNFDFDPAQFASFLARSLPPLQSLYLASSDQNDVADEWLRLVPSITDLAISFTNNFEDPFRILLANGQDFLPNLSYLHIED
ncbi:hypothetical protein K438DRAFT_1955331 [Mycena galopus ATCC 62051]|nr:hypothetical protein K438DRAFT_1955331 [Mycena galopus ATCC 62051]